MKVFKNKAILIIFMFIFFVGAKSALGEVVYGDGSYNNPIKLVNGSNAQKYISMGEYHYYKLEVLMDGEVELMSNGEIDLQGCLEDRYHSYLEEDYDSGIGKNFRIVRFLHRGIYYLKVSGNIPGSHGMYNISVKMPKKIEITANPSSGTYEGPIDIELLSNISNASIYYEINREPEPPYGQPYREPIHITTSSSIFVTALYNSPAPYRFRFDYKIEPKMDKIVLENKVNIQLGVRKKLEKYIYPEKAANNTLIWSSSNPQVATVDQNGVVYAMSEGETMITVTNSEGNVTDKSLVRTYRGYRLMANMDFVYGSKGEKVRVPVTLKNVDAYNGVEGYQFQINFDSEKLNLEDVKAGEVIKREGSDWNYSVTTPGAIRFVYVNTDPENGIKMDGNIAYLDFIVREVSEPGDARIDFNESERLMFIDKNLNRIDTIYGSGSVVVKEDLYGDLDHDGSVDVRDLYMIKRYILKVENSIPGERLKYADVNGDGYIDVIDAMYIQRYILEQIDKFPVE